MAEIESNAEVTKEKTVTVDDASKTPEVKVEEKAAIAPEEEKSIEGDDSTTKEQIDDVLLFLNSLDKARGGKGEIAEITEDLRSPIGYLIEVMTKLREAYKDPNWEAIVDDMNDQVEDGETPSVAIAIARTMPLAKLQELVESEDYEGARNEVTNALDEKGRIEDEELMYAEGFEATQKAGEEYAAEMGYDEERKNVLFTKVMDLFKVMGDGKLTKAEFADVDKMLNYDTDTEALKSQISDQPAKEVLPDQASMDSALPPPPASKAVGSRSTPGMESMSAYIEPETDITSVGKRKRM